jgi:hypothetical protein
MQKVEVAPREGRFELRFSCSKQDGGGLHLVGCLRLVSCVA